MAFVIDSVMVKINEVVAEENVCLTVDKNEIEVELKEGAEIELSMQNEILETDPTSEANLKINRPEGGLDFGGDIEIENEIDPLAEGDEEQLEADSQPDVANDDL